MPPTMRATTEHSSYNYSWWWGQMMACRGSIFMTVGFKANLIIPNPDMNIPNGMIRFMDQDKDKRPFFLFFLILATSLLTAHAQTPYGRRSCAWTSPTSRLWSTCSSSSTSLRRPSCHRLSRRRTAGRSTGAENCLFRRVHMQDKGHHLAV